MLDVKLRAQEVRERRLLGGMRFLAVLVLLAVVGFTGWQGSRWALDRLIYQNEMFAVRTIDVRTDGGLSAEQVRRWGGVKVGDNLLALDLRRIQRDLELVPAIESAAVERVLPHTLKLRVGEREPVARVQVVRPAALPGRVEAVTYGIDGLGFVMSLMRDGRPMPAAAVESLPVVSGVSFTEISPGRVLENSRVRSALEFLRAFEQSPLMGVVDLRQVDVASPGVLTCTTGQGTEVTLAAGQMEQQLLRWRAVHDHGLTLGKSIASMDLSVSNNVPARWMELSALPEKGPKPVKPSRFRKRHV